MTYFPGKVLTIDPVLVLCCSHLASMVCTAAVWFSSLDVIAKGMVAVLDAVFIGVTIYWILARRKTNRLEQEKLQLEIDSLRERLKE